MRLFVGDAQCYRVPDNPPTNVPFCAEGCSAAAVRSALVSPFRAHAYNNRNAREVPAVRVRMSTEEELLAETARKFAKGRLRQNVRRMDEAEEFDMGAFREACELGFSGLMIPQELGGCGVDPLSTVTVLEELGAGSPSFALSLGAHFLLFGHNLAREGSESLRKRYLPDIVSGKRIGAMALTEPEHGSDAVGIETAAERTGDGFLLSGSKTFITNAPIADLFLVYAKTGPGPKGLSPFVVERGFGGVVTGPALRKMGNRSSPTGDVHLDGCPVPAENRVGSEDDGVHVLMRGLDIERIVLSAIYLGAMRWAMEIARDYSTLRRQFGRPLSEFQMLQSKLSEMAMGYECARVYLREVAKECALNPGARTLRGSAAAVKVIVGRTVESVTREALQILGGTGYMRDSVVEMLYRDGRLTSIGAGTEEIDKLIVFKSLLAGDFVR